MNEPELASIGEQTDELVAHLIERQDRLAADVARGNAELAALRSRISSVIFFVVMLFWLIFGVYAWRT